MFVASLLSPPSTSGRYNASKHKQLVAPGIHDGIIIEDQNFSLRLTRLVANRIPTTQACYFLREPSNRLIARKQSKLKHHPIRKNYIHTRNNNEGNHVGHCCDHATLRRDRRGSSFTTPPPAIAAVKVCIVIRGMATATKPGGSRDVVHRTLLTGGIGGGGGTIEPSST